VVDLSPDVIGSALDAADDLPTFKFGAIFGGRSVGTGISCGAAHGLICEGRRVRLTATTARRRALSVLAAR
jgi:hypothetical protein